MRTDRFEDSLSAPILHAGGLAEIRLGTGLRLVVAAPSWVLAHPLVLTVELGEGEGLLELRQVDSQASYKAHFSPQGRRLTEAERQAAPAGLGVRSVSVFELPETMFRWAREQDMVARALSLPAQEPSNVRDGMWVSVEAWQGGRRVGVTGLTYDLDADLYPEHAALVHALFSACLELPLSEEERISVACCVRSALPEPRRHQRKERKVPG